MWANLRVIDPRAGLWRLMLLDDAVHQVSPTGALGMNTGIADAVDLGWKLEAVEKGWGGAQLMSGVGAMFRTRGVQLGYRYDDSPICVPDGSAVPPGDVANLVDRVRGATP